MQSLPGTTVSGNQQSTEADSPLMLELMKESTDVSIEQVDSKDTDVGTGVAKSVTGSSNVVLHAFNSFSCFSHCIALLPESLRTT